MKIIFLAIILVFGQAYAKASDKEKSWDSLLFTGRAQSCQEIKDKVFRRVISKCLKGSLYQMRLKNSPLCEVGQGNIKLKTYRIHYQCFSSYEEETVNFPEVIALRDRKNSFNYRYNFILRNGNIWVKGRESKNSKWEILKVHSLLYRPVEISADDRNVIAIDSNRKVFTMFGGVFDSPKKFSWTKRWGFPFWGGSGWNIPKEMVKWDVSFFSPQVDKYYLDPIGNKHHVGVGVTHIWMIGPNRQSLYFNDPWLPNDTSYGLCTPLRGRFKAQNLSTNGSKILVVNKAGEMYTRSFDFDMGGYNGLAFHYTYNNVPKLPENSEIKAKRKLPVPGWVKQPKVEGVITDHISVHKIGIGGLNRILRVEGVDKNGRTGFYQKNADFDKVWKFTPTYRPLKGMILGLKNSPIQEDLLGPDKSQAFVSKSKSAKLKIPNFHLYCSPSTLKVTMDNGESLDLILHYREGIRISKHPAGLADRSKYLKGAIEIPKKVLRKLRSLPKRSQNFIKTILKKKRFTTISLKATKGELVITGAREFQWKFNPDSI